MRLGNCRCVGEWTMRRDLLCTALVATLVLGCTPVDRPLAPAIVDDGTGYGTAGAAADGTGALGGSGPVAGFGAVNGAAGTLGTGNGLNGNAGFGASGSGASTSNGAGMSGAGASNSAPAPAGEPCTTAGMIRCRTQGSAERQRCDGMTWVPDVPCAASEVCDSSTPAATCSPAPAVCQGNGGHTVCDGSELHQCSVDGASVMRETCVSAQHCQLGMASQHCAMCLTNEFKCEGANLMRCSDDGMGFTMAKTCDSVALCNASARDCTTAACAADGFQCKTDGTLQKCKTDLSGFEDVKPCMKGLCDKEAGECDVCVAGEKKCANPSTLATCDPQGQQLAMTPCPSATPVCTGTGVCVQCAQDSDCPPAKECMQNRCNKAMGMCMMQPVASGKCSSGVCDGQGMCVGCLQDGDCTGSARQCVQRQCKQCDPSGTNTCPQPSNDCQEVSCSGSGTCGAPTNKGSGESCRTGGGKVCDGRGSCVACLTNQQCGGSTAYCVRNQCRQCDPSGANTCPQGNNPCAEVICGSDGTCGAERAKPGATCDGVCNGTKCAECSATNISRCTGSPVECTERACTANGECTTRPISTSGARCGQGLDKVCDRGTCRFFTDHESCTGSNNVESSCRFGSGTQDVGLCFNGQYCARVCSTQADCPLGTCRDYYCQK